MPSVGNRLDRFAQQLLDRRAHNGAMFMAAASTLTIFVLVSLSFYLALCVYFVQRSAFLPSGAEDWGPSIGMLVSPLISCVPGVIIASIHAFTSP